MIGAILVIGAIPFFQLSGGSCCWKKPFPLFPLLVLSIPLLHLLYLLLLHLLLFNLNASLHLYERISVSVGPSVGLFIRQQQNHNKIGKNDVFQQKKSLQKLSKVWKILSGSILASLQNGRLVSRSGCLLRSLEIQWKSNFFHKSKLEEASQTISIGQSFYQSWGRIVFLMGLVQSNSYIRHIITTSTGVAGSLVVVAGGALVLDAIRRY